ncbi:uncharacterized protein [Spinacia oleracea]|uniref:Uncharacterized protein isoform X2 n=1 Tax=Spinacia oleracea TaxID=3562 RepID=A0A9R0JRB0_SPIOL|nr:uncharacterized protein LOC110784131 isoform X2 [Spinacia oleracea]XP_056694317.1 uncharacterized protein LOC110784131 isoform X2 [Spinacia oleracea]
MTTVGLELTSFIDPSLTWKTVSKGRNTSRRSRRSASKNMKIVQEHDKRSPKRLNSLQCSESEKSNVMLHGRRFPSNMEHIPIKKRKLFVRSPSPPLPSPNCQEESEGPVTCSESQVMGINFPQGSKSKTCESDGNIYEKSVKSLFGAHGSKDDFSGIAILAAAACSDRLDNSTDDAGNSQSQMGGVDREKKVSSVFVSHMKENFSSIHTPDLLGKDIEHVEGISVVDLPKDSSQVVSMNYDADEVGMSPIKEFQQADQNDKVASTSAVKESVECLGLPRSLGSAAYVNKESLSGSSNEVADKTSENSGATRDCRFHWDLNTVMDEWDEPLDDTGDTGVSSGTQLVEVAPVNIMDSQNLEDMEVSETKRSEIQNLDDVKGLEADRAEPSVSGDRVFSQAEACADPESVTLPDKNEGFTSVSPTFSRLGHCSEVSAGFVTSILKENICPSNASVNVVESSVCVADSEIQPEVVNEDAKIDHSLSLGINGTKISASEETDNGAGSENLNEVAETSRTVKSEEHEINFLLAPLSGKFSEVVDADCKHIEDPKLRNVLGDESDNKVAHVTLGSRQCEIPALDTREFREIFCRIDESDNSRQCVIPALDAQEFREISCRMIYDLNCQNSEPPKQISLLDSEVKHEEIISRPLESSQPSSSENVMVESKDFSASLCSEKIMDGVTSSMTMGNHQTLEKVIDKEIQENLSVTDASESDRSEALVPKMFDHCVAVDACSKPSISPLAEKSLGGIHGSHVSKEDSSQLTENAGTVAEFERGYDSHLEDGELRESQHHCWEEEDNDEGEVVLVGGECEKQSFRSDNFSSADNPPNLDNKSIEESERERESCSLRFQGCVSNVVDAMEEEAVCTTKRESSSSALKACSAANNSDKKDNSRSSIEADSMGKEFDNVLLPRNSRGASASGRDLQFSDRRCTDSMRRSRSSNFDCMHRTDGPDEPMTRNQQPTMRMGRFNGRSWNPELKNSASEDDGERILRTPGGDTSPFRGRRPRIINTSSRSGYHFMRRGGSPGEQRDSGDYGMGMMKTRDMSPDNNNPRSRFGRFNGINRGFREGYRGRPGVYEGPKSGGGGPMLNRFGKRERSFSPVGGDRFHRKSRSRSRTRSPDFRCEARMGRGRLPYQQTEHTRERRSPPPVRVFNQNQRFDSVERMRSDDCMRPAMRGPMRFHDTTTSGRGQGHDFEEGDDYNRRKPPLMRNRQRSRSRSRSCSPDFRPDGRPDSRMGSVRVPYHQPRSPPPVRVFRADQRFESGPGSPPVRLRSDECLRPVMRPQRFHEFNNNNNNSNNNGDDFRRKPRNIFERIHPGRQQYGVEGGVRRFQYDNEDGGPSQNFRRNESFGRGGGGGGDRRPVEFRGGPREERGNVRYNNNNNNNSSNSDRMFYSGPKQFGGGIRDYAEDGPPGRVRQ